MPHADYRKQLKNSARRPVVRNAKPMPHELTAKGLILATLKEAYFRRLKLEKHGQTPRLTQEINLLELAIRDLTEHINETEQSESGA